MDYEIINVGSLPNDGSGDPMRVAFIKINNNFALTSNLTPSGNTGEVQFATVTTNGNVTYSSFSSSPAFSFDSGNGNLNLGANVMPQTTDVMNIGAPSKRVGAIFLGANAFYQGNINVTEFGNIMNFNISVYPQSKADIVVGGIDYGYISNRSTLNTTSLVTNTVSPTAVYTIPVSDFSTGKFEIISRESTSNNSQSVTIVVSKTNDESNVSYTAFGTLVQGNCVARYDVDVFASNVRVIVIPYVSSTVTHRVNYQINV
jgi:hypothetical protein